MYTLIIRQCLPNLKSKIKGSNPFVKVDNEKDIIQLLLTIRGFCCRFNDHQQPTWALEQATHQVSTYYHAHDVTNTEYVEPLKALVGVIKTHRGVYGREPGLVTTQLIAQGVRPKDINKADQKEVAKAKEACRECYNSCMLLLGFNNGGYYQLKVDLSHNMTKGADNFPKTMGKTMHLLTNYVCDPDPDGKGLAFVQGGSPKRDSASKGKIKCWQCSEPHYKNKCPKLKMLDAGVQNLNIEDCDKEHDQSLVDDGYRLVQKQAKGV